MLNLRALSIVFVSSGMVAGLFMGTAQAMPAPEPEYTVLTATADVEVGHIELPAGSDPGPSGLPGYPPPNQVNPETGMTLYRGSAQWKVRITYNTTNPEAPTIGAWIRLSTFKNNYRWNQYYGESEFRIERCSRKKYFIVATSTPFFSQDLTEPGEYITATSKTKRRYIFGQTFQQIDPIVRVYSSTQKFRVVITQRVANVKGVVGAPLLTLSPSNPWEIATKCMRLS